MNENILSQLIATGLRTLLASVTTVFVGSKIRFKQQFRLAKNLNRTVAFIKNGVNLKNDEIRLLRTNGLFNKIDEIDNINSFTNENPYGVIVIVYNPLKKQETLDFIKKARATNFPIIFYTNHETIDAKYIGEVNQYPKVNISQYSLNLISAIFTILATYNHGNR